MKKFVLIALICLSCLAQAQRTDSIPSDSTESPFTLNAYLYSRYVWRGVNFGSSPSAQGQLMYGNSGFFVGCFVAKALNGNLIGFSNTSNIFLGYGYKGVSLTVDDCFFYDETNLDRYLDWTSDTTLHFIETRLRYDRERWYSFVGVNVYGAKANYNDGVYIEAGYKFPKHGLTLFAGGLTGRSDLNFSTAAGVTNIGITKEKMIRISPSFSLPITGSVIVNPNYTNIVDLPRVSRDFVTLVLGTYF